MSASEEPSLRVQLEVARIHALKDDYEFFLPITGGDKVAAALLAATRTLQAQSDLTLHALGRIEEAIEGLGGERA